MKKLSTLLLITFMVGVLCLVIMGQNGKDCNVLFPISDMTGKYGYINKNGELIIKPKFIVALNFNEGVGVVKTSCKETGYVDYTGRLTKLPGVIIIGGEFSEGTALAEKEGKYGYYVDKLGRVLFKLPEYKGLNYPNNFSEGLVSAEAGEGGFTFLDKEGKRAFENLIFDAPSSFKDGMSLVRIDDVWVIINEKGKRVFTIADNELNNAGKPSEGLVRFGIESETIYVDKTGKVALKVPYKVAGDFNQELAPFLYKTKWGYLNKKGETIINPKYEDVKSFSDGLAAVNVDGKYGFITQQGKLTIAHQFDFAQQFECGLAFVSKNCHDNPEEGYINQKGQWIWKKNITSKSGCTLNP